MDDLPDNGSFLSPYASRQKPSSATIRSKHLPGKTKIILVLLLLLFVTSIGYFAWFGLIGSGLPIAWPTHFRVENGLPDEILVGPDQNLWFNYVLLPGRGRNAHIGSITPNGQKTPMHLTYRY